MPWRGWTSGPQKGSTNDRLSHLIERVGLISVPSHLRTQAAKPRTASRPKLAWMMLAGSGIAGREGKIRVGLELEILSH